VSISRGLPPTLKLSVLLCRGTNPWAFPRDLPAVNDVQPVRNSQQRAPVKEISFQRDPGFVFAAGVRRIVEARRRIGRIRGAASAELDGLRALRTVILIDAGCVLTASSRTHSRDDSVRDGDLTASGRID
jgi:hypothetical protein